MIWVNNVFVIGVSNRPIVVIQTATETGFFSAGVHYEIQTQ